MSIYKKTDKDNFKNSICYIPFVAIFLFFTEKNKSKEYAKNIKYWIFLLIFYVVLNFFVWFFFPFWWFLKSLIGFVYLWASWFLWFKAYKWENVELEVFDEIEKNVKEKIDENNK